MCLLHERAVCLAREFKRVEAELIDVLQRINQEKVFRAFGYNSLFEYATRGLGLSESVSYALITVSRKAIEVPALRLAIEEGSLTVSKAKMMTSILTVDNAGELIKKAQTLSHRELEKEVARIHPKAAAGERAKYITEDRVELRLSLQEMLMKKLRRAQDLEAQRTAAPADLEATLQALVDFYLERHDPIVKAERYLQKPSARKVEISLKRKADSSTLQRRYSAGKKYRTPLPARTQHLIQLRDRGQCTHVNPHGERCQARRWLEMHHEIPLSEGGTNNIDNLATLCSVHHRQRHDRSV